MVGDQLRRDRPSIIEVYFTCFNDRTSSKLSNTPYFCSVPYRYSAHTRMGCPICTICIWAAHTRTGSPYAYGIPVRVWAAHTRTGSPYTRMHGPKLLLPPYAYMSAHMRIGILDHSSIARYSYSYDVGIATISF